LSGTFRVTQSALRNVGDGTRTANLKGADVVVSGNVIEATSYAGFYFYGGESYRSTIRVKENQIRGYVGLALEQWFNEPMDCRLQANNVSDTEFVGIWLGAGTTGCYVIGGSTKTTVVDDGAGNVLVGVNNMGSGLGPTGGGNC